MPYKDIFHRALGGELINKTRPVMDLLRYIQAESDLNKQYTSNSEDTRTKLKEFYGFLEEVLEMKEEVSSKSEFQLHHDLEAIEISDFDIDIKKAVLGQIKEGLNSVAPQEGEDPASGEISVTLQTKQWTDILEKMAKHSEVIELLNTSLQMLNKINQTYIDAAEVYDKKYDNEGNFIRTESRNAEVAQILGLNKSGKRQETIDRSQLYIHFMIRHALAKKRGKLSSEKVNDIIQSLSKMFDCNISTTKQYLKEEISKRQTEDNDYLSPDPQEMYLRGLRRSKD